MHAGGWCGFRTNEPECTRKIVPPVHHRDTGAQRNIETINPIETMVVERRGSSPSCSQTAESRPIHYLCGD